MLFQRSLWRTPCPIAKVSNTLPHLLWQSCVTFYNFSVILGKNFVTHVLCILLCLISTECALYVDFHLDIFFSFLLKNVHIMRLVQSTKIRLCFDWKFCVWKNGCWSFTMWRESEFTDLYYKWTLVYLELIWFSQPWNLRK